MNKKKLLALLMALVMTLSLMPMTVIAEELGTVTPIAEPAEVVAVESVSFEAMNEVAEGSVAQVGENGYSTFADALAAWADGTTLTLLQDVEVALDDSIDIFNKAVVLDLNGHTITATQSPTVFYVGSTGSLTIYGNQTDPANPGTISKTYSGGYVIKNYSGNLSVIGGIYKISGNTAIKVFYLAGDHNTISDATIRSESTNTSAYAVEVIADSTAELTNCKLYSQSGYCVTKGNSASPNNVKSLEMTDCELSGKSGANTLYFDNAVFENCTFNVEGIGVYGKANKTFVKNCVINCTNTETANWAVRAATIQGNENVITVTGSGTALYAATVAENAFVKINATTIGKSTSKFNGTGWLSNNDLSNVTLGADRKCIARESSDEEYSTYPYEIVPATYVAQIGTTKYETLQAAIDDAQNGATITLLTDVSDGSGLIVRDGQPKNITIDFNTYTYTMKNPSVGSTGTETQALHFSDNSTVTLKNGTFRVAEDAVNVKMLMQNYAALTIEDMIIDGTSIAVRNYGNTYTGEYEIFNGTVIPQFNFNRGSATIRNSTISLAGDVSICSPVSIDGSTVIQCNKIVTKGTDERYASDPDVNINIENGAKFSDDGVATILASAQTLSEKANDLYTVIAKPTYVAQIGTTKYTTLAEAIAAAQDGDTVELLQDIALDGTTTIEKSITIDGNNKTLTVTKHDSGNYALYVIDENEPVKKKLNVAIKDLNMTTTGYQVAVMLNGSYDSTLALNNVNITCDGECIYANGLTSASANNCNFTHEGTYATGKDAVYYSALIVGYGGNLEVSNCTVTSFGNGASTFPSGGSITLTNTDISINETAASEANAGYAIWSRNEDYTNYPEYCRDSVITFHSGKVSGDFKITDKYPDGDAKNKYDAKIVVDGGYFTVDPTAYVADGYEAVAKTNTIGDITYNYVVGKITTTPLQANDDATDTSATYDATKTVVDENGTPLTTAETPISVTVTANQTETSTKATAKISNITAEALRDVVGNAADKAGDASASEANVVITVAKSDATPAENTITYEVHPEAIITVSNSDESTTVALTNEQIQGEFTFKLNVSTLNAEQVTVVHKHADGTSENMGTFVVDTDGNITLTVSSFSEFDISAATVDSSKTHFDFKGIGLRRRVRTNDGTTVVRSTTDIRFGYELKDYSASNTYYFRWKKDGGEWSNPIEITNFNSNHTEAALVINKVPSSAFGTIIYTRIFMVDGNGNTYVLDGEGKSVDGAIEAITDPTNGFADKWVDYAKFLKGEIGQYSISDY